MINNSYTVIRAAASRLTYAQRSLAFMVALLLIGGGVSGCSGPIQLQSQSMDREVTIDGDANDWQNVLRPTRENPDISLGALNDGEHLYLIIVTQNRDHIRGVVRTGLTTTFAAGGESSSRFGIRYPLGLINPDEPPSSRQRRDPDVMREKWKSQLSEMEIIQQNAQARRLPIKGLAGIDAAATLSSGVLICEYRVPLQGGGQYQYAISSAPGQSLKVAFETPQPERPEMNSNPTGGRASSGGFGRNRGRQRQMPRPTGQEFATIDVETEIVLAE